MAPARKLPHGPMYADEEAYVEALLQFITHSTMLQSLCGGVHILDFLTSTPDLYQSILPEDWRAWLRSKDIDTILDVLMRDELPASLVTFSEQSLDQAPSEKRFSNGSPPGKTTSLPPTLLAYITAIRNLSLDRSFAANPFTTQKKRPKLSRHIAVGMKPKKAHEVENLAGYIDELTAEIAHDKSPHTITHLVDFGSGQNYLGRALASPPYRKKVVAVESKPNNILEAKTLDINAKLAKKELVLRNKKAHRAVEKAKVVEGKSNGSSCRLAACESETRADQKSVTCEQEEPKKQEKLMQQDEHQRKQKEQWDEQDDEQEKQSTWLGDESFDIQYVEHVITDGNLDFVVKRLQGHHQQRTSPNHEIFPDQKNPRDHENAEAGITSGLIEGADTATEKQRPPATTTTRSSPSPTRHSHCDFPQLMVVSLHSCGNLLHHGLRSLVLNPAVKAVALVGCCYNLVTERLGPPTYKLPSLRRPNTRLVSTACVDPHGFPLSARFASQPYPHGSGVRLNITARMLAVQAPQNWTTRECDAFFTRHFFRALLQRIFLDRGVVTPPPDNDNSNPAAVEDGVSPRGWTGDGPAIVLGSLRKGCYATFVAYVRGAVAKLDDGTARGDTIAEKMGGLSDEEIAAYEWSYAAQKHELCVVWSLMAFSAAVIESAIVVDRWLFLREQDVVRDCWVETVFEYAQSPRNLAVVGIKR